MRGAQVAVAGDGLGVVVDLGLATEVVDVALDSAHGDEQPAGNLAVAESLGDTVLRLFATHLHIQIAFGVGQYNVG